MNIRFTKIRYAQKDEKPVNLAWKDASGADSITTTLESASEPEPEFIKTLRAFRPEVLKLCRLPRAWGDDAEVRQVTIGWTKDDRRTVQITMVKPLPDSNAPLVINTPYLPEPAENGQGGGMSTNMMNLLDQLEQVAERYVAGERAQKELALDDAREKKNGRRVKQDDIEEAIEGSDDEAGYLIRRREHLAALKLVLGSDRQFAQAPTDQELAVALIEEFDRVETHDPDDADRQTLWPGIFQHAPEPVPGGPGYVWCAVRTDGGVPAFWYDVDPPLFLANWSALAATLRGAPLFAAVHELFDLPTPDEPSAQDATENEVVSTETAEQWAERTFPRPDAGDVAGAILQTLHVVALGDQGEMIDSWFAAHLEGVTDAELLSMFETGLVLRAKGQEKFGLPTVATGSQHNEQEIVYVEVTARIDSGAASITAGKGRKKQTVDFEQIVQLLRALLDISDVTVGVNADDTAGIWRFVHNVVRSGAG
ncbi:MAG: hypothetical protein ACRENP_17515 [Longimicrobiales bacterium]